MGRDLDESALDEATGVCNNVAVDWNQDGDTSDGVIAVDLNGDGDTTDICRDQPNWAKLNLTGPRTSAD
jgi:hypothetical protein